MVRKQVDYDQLQELLDVCAKDPTTADKERLHQLLMAMGESASEIDTADTWSTINASTNDHGQGLADYLNEYLGDRLTSPLTVTEMESNIAALRAATEGNAYEEAMGMNNDELQQSCAEEQVVVEFMPRNPYGNSADGLHTSSPRCVSTRQLSQTSAASSSSSNMPRDTEERRSSIDHSITPETRAVHQRTRLEMHKQEVLEVFGTSWDEEDFGTATQRPPARTSNMETFKQEILEFCGVHVES